ncbi:response regulator [uncultured Pedobacter sp.]|uniref:response regulator transcription factor n=1 Tax=uncultured Pedobacter sp. TaxID=246139 RepID=UPI0025E3569E|nr:response regulator [uncultured Pedobacter sp.]
MEKYILIIEDDEDISEVFQVIFEMAGYHTTVLTVAPDPEFIHKQNFRLIIMDIRLVGSRYNGNELCRIFKLRYPDNKTPVLLMSAESNGDILARECGADGFMNKPFDVDDLLARASEMMV